MNLFSKPNNQLIAGCKANKRSAQEGLYKRYYTEMLRLCYRYLKSDELACEALNTGFLKVFSNIGSFDEEKGEFKYWIKTIMVRTCIDLSRKESKFITAPYPNIELDDAFITPEVLDKLYTQDLLKALRRLPAATQIVFNLFVIDGYTHNEIAKQLQITDGTSRWHLSQAKKLLRAILEDGPTENQNKGK